MVEESTIVPGREISCRKVPSAPGRRATVPTRGKVDGDTEFTVADTPWPLGRMIVEEYSRTAVNAVILPELCSCWNVRSSDWGKGTATETTDTSPPLAWRTLAVSELLTIDAAICSPTMAMTPTPTQKAARTVRRPPRVSERVV
jgi:hypothetical protein